jgi:hypothetical protein
VVRELEITAGETIADLSVVLVIGSAVLRGQVQITGGTLSPDGRVRISARRKDGGSGPFLSLPILWIDLAPTSRWYLFFTLFMGLHEDDDRDAR